MKLLVRDIAKALQPESIDAKANRFLAGGVLQKAGLLAGTAHCAYDVLCTKACTDSRDVTQGSLFFCLHGERVDGHNFAGIAAQNGAAVIVAEYDVFAEQRACMDSVPVVLLVDDSLKALWRLAMHQRAITRAFVVGITGSAGKTSAKESLAQILSCKGKTAKNYKNFNTQVGLSLSLLNADTEAKYWVMEAGISQPKDMDELGMLLQPDAAIVLNVANAHAEGLGKMGTAYHKTRLLLYVRPGGQAFVSEDYEDLNREVDTLDLAALGITLRRFSAQGRDVFSQAKFTGLAEKNGGVFSVSIDGSAFIVEAPFIGSAGAENIAALAAFCLCNGFTSEVFAKSIAGVTLPEQRFNKISMGDITLIDDSYNANPLSSQKMIEAASCLCRANKGKLVLVMGEMRELGEDTAPLHEQLGKDMAHASPFAVFWKGGFAEKVEKGLTEQGYSGPFFRVDGEGDFITHCEVLPLENTFVLFKGSRYNQLEVLIKALQERLKDN